MKPAPFWPIAIGVILGISLFAAAAEPLAMFVIRHSGLSVLHGIAFGAVLLALSSALVVAASCIISASLGLSHRWYVWLGSFSVLLLMFSVAYIISSSLDMVFFGVLREYFPWYDPLVATFVLASFLWAPVGWLLINFAGYFREDSDPNFV